MRLVRSPVFAVPSATPQDIVKKVSDALIEADTDEKVKQLLANNLIVGPLTFEATNARFKRDTEIMLAVLKEIGLKPEKSFTVACVSGEAARKQRADLRAVDRSAER